MYTVYISGTAKFDKIQTDFLLAATVQMHWQLNSGKTTKKKSPHI